MTQTDSTRSGLSWTWVGASARYIVQIPDSILSSIHSPVATPDIPSRTYMHPSEKSPKVAAQKAHTTEKHVDGPVEGADPRAHANHILGGYKSVLQNPNAPEYSKQHAREILLMEGTDCNGDVPSAEPDSQRAPNPNVSF